MYAANTRTVRISSRYLHVSLVTPSCAPVAPNEVVLLTILGAVANCIHVLVDADSAVARVDYSTLVVFNQNAVTGDSYHHYSIVQSSFEFGTLIRWNFAIAIDLEDASLCLFVIASALSTLTTVRISCLSSLRCNFQVIESFARVHDQ